MSAPKREREEEHDVSDARPRFLKVERILMQDPDAKSAFVLCKQGEVETVVCLNKKPWTEADVRFVLEEEGTALHELHRNDKFSKYDAEPPAKANRILVDYICPANELDVAKYSQQQRHVVRETRAVYDRVTRPHVEGLPVKQTKWIDKILQRQAEMELLLYEDETCMLLPDTKWDRQDASALYTLAIFKDSSLKSVRDLTGSHAPALRTMREGVLSALRERFGVAPSQIRAYFHYLPSFWHAHVHFATLTCHNMGSTSAVGKAILLDDVIDWLERDPSYFSSAALTFLVGERDGLWPKLVAAGVC